MQKGVPHGWQQNVKWGMDPMSANDVGHNGMLTYGSVELCLNREYTPGDVIKVDDRLYIEIVDRVEKADGIITLALVPRKDQRPSCLCVLFTHYMRKKDADMVDHVATVTHLSLPTETVRKMTERAFQRDLVTRSVSASLAYHPTVRYL